MPFRRYVAWLMPGFLGIVIGLAAFGLADAGGDDRSAEPNTPGGPSWRRDPGAAELRDQVRTVTHPAVAEARRQVSSDRDQARFTGRLGGFSVVGSAPLNNYGCDAARSSQRARPTGSELDVGEDLRSVESLSCGGAIYSVSGQARAASGSHAEVIRTYYQGTTPRLPVEAPRERLQLTTVGGKEALLETPAQQLFPECRLFVIERTPKRGTPGIIWEISGSVTCEDATAVADQLLAAGS
jgi:hypothetical protein